MKTKNATEPRPTRFVSLSSSATASTFHQEPSTLTPLALARTQLHQLALEKIASAARKHLAVAQPTVMNALQ